MEISGKNGKILIEKCTAIPKLIENGRNYSREIQMKSDENFADNFLFFCTEINGGKLWKFF